MSQAQKRIAKEPYKARKGFFHGYRYLVFTEQLFASGRITDYSAANAFLAEVVSAAGNYQVRHSLSSTANDVCFSVPSRLEHPISISDADAPSL